MKTKYTSPITHLVLALALSLGVQAETAGLVVNTCKSNTRDRLVPISGSADGQTTVTLSERGGYTFTLPALVLSQKGSTVGSKVGLGKVPSGPALYVATLTAAKQAIFKEVEAGTYRVFLIPATKELAPVKDAAIQADREGDANRSIYPGTEVKEPEKAKGVKGIKVELGHLPPP